jgi:predicted peptidase
MKIPSPRLLFVCASALLVGAPIATAAESQTVASFERTVSKKVGYSYLLSLPTGYQPSGEKTWPLILFLHGSGERGSDPWLVARHGPPKLIRGDVPGAAPTKGKASAPAETPEAAVKREQSAKLLRENFIVVSPQCPLTTRWDDDAVLALLDEIIAKHKVDVHRVYLTGLSMGGYGTWSVGLKNPQRFAAIVPICGGGMLIDVLLGAREQKSALTSLGVSVFHGGQDPTVPVVESERLVAALKKAGVTDVQFTVYPEAKHDSWTETYNNPELYAWLLRHERNESVAAK